MLPKRECPLCGNKEVEKIYSLNFPNNEEINGLPNNCDIVICNNCKLAYYDFDSSQKQFDDYYNKNSAYSQPHHIFYDDEHSKTYKQTFNFINKYLNSKESKILEFGCGTGELLKIFHNNGYSNLLGIDESNAFDKIKREYNINFQYGNIFSGKEQINDTFDLVILSHMLGHIYNIKEPIKNIKNLLNKEGYLYIESPDAQRYKEIYMAPLFYFNYEIISHLSKPAIINLANIYGFDIVSIEECMRASSIPSFRVLLKNNPNNNDIKTSLNQHINDSIEDINNNIIKRLISSNEKVILWGIGSTTLHLFSLGLENLNIVDIVDASTKKQGKTLLGHKIISPNEIKDEDATILILPVVYYDSIYKQIKEMGLKNKIYAIAEQSRAEQSRAEQSRAEQSSNV